MQGISFMLYWMQASAIRFNPYLLEKRMVTFRVLGCEALKGRKLLYLREIEVLIFQIRIRFAELQI